MNSLTSCMDNGKGTNYLPSFDIVKNVIIKYLHAGSQFRNLSTV